jgi:hypothetical protein
MMDMFDNNKVRATVMENLTSLSTVGMAIDETIRVIRQQLAKPAVEWISVLETKPPVNELIIVCVVNAANLTMPKHITVGKVEPSDLWLFDSKPYSFFKVTHWQPLPAAYDALQDK